MSKRGMSASAHSVTGAVVFLLVSLFAVLALVVVVTGIQAYRGISDMSAENARNRAALSYVVNRVRAADRLSGVVTREDGEGLCLVEEIEGEKYATWIYCADGALKEYFGLYADGNQPEYGQRIAEASRLSATEEAPGLLAVQVDFAGGGSAAMHVGLRAGN